MAINVLVVDDSEVVRSMIVKTVRLTGIELGQVHEASNGADALAVLETNWIDLVFVDINMPVMNGEEMIRRVRANVAWADLPMIIVSTEGSQTRIESLLDDNARFIHKPFTPEQIRDVANEMLGICHERTQA